MSQRKTPILLRQGPVSGRVHAIFRYTRSKGRNGRDIIKASLDGKEDVTADFDALVCELLFDPDSPKIIEQLDGASRSGISLTEAERDEIKKFRERLIVLVERHNNEGHGRG
jgi:hypothetical protein